MIRFLKNLVVFCFLALLLYIPSVLAAGIFLPEDLRPNIVSGTANVGFTKERLAEARITGRVDILILGSSHAYRGFDPRVFERSGIRIFNLGSTAQTPLQSDILLREYINDLDPGVVVLEVFPWTFTSDGMESSLDLMLQSDEIPFNELILKRPNLKMLSASIFDWMNMEQNRRIDLGDKYIRGGYAEMANRPFNQNWDNMEKWAWKEEQFQALGQLEDYLSNKEIKLILVETPVSEHLYNSYPNRELFKNRMNEIAKYVDFNELDILSDSTHFYDSDHMNQPGVELFNRALIDSLSAQGIIPK